MALADIEIWSNQNPPAGSIEDASTQAQNDVGQGIQCGQPISPDGINFALHKYSACLFGELNSLSTKAGVTYDTENPVNIRDAICKMICDAFESRNQGARVPLTGLQSNAISFTVPGTASDTWLVDWDYNGAGDTPNVDSSNPQSIFLNNNDNAISAGDVAEMAGGTVITINQGSNVSGYLTWSAILKSCSP